MKSIVAEANKMLSVKPVPKSVRIEAHRSYKELPFDSNDIVRKLKPVLEKHGVDPITKGYEKEMNISVTKEAAFMSMGKEKASGGLPVGSSGKAVILLSGGIDSPVAAWYAMKRGMQPIYVHIHSFQNADEAMKGKIPVLIKTLSGFHPRYSAYFVPSHIFQAASMGLGKYELVMMKTFFLRLAEQVALKEGAHAIFTGESLGQVASQTAGEHRGGAVRAQGPGPQAADRLRQGGDHKGREGDRHLRPVDNAVQGRLLDEREEPEAELEPGEGGRSREAHGHEGGSFQVPKGVETDIRVAHVSPQTFLYLHVSCKAWNF